MFALIPPTIAKTVREVSINPNYHCPQLSQTEDLDDVRGVFIRKPQKPLKGFNPEHDVHFFLYTQKNPHIEQNIYPDDISSLLESNFDFKKKTKILIHGWKNTANSTFGRTVTDAYLHHMPVNVIVVDWATLSHRTYRKSLRYMDLVGGRVARLYDCLRCFVPRDSIHVIGHSLGAHVAGIVGQMVSTGPIYRITGLDPAGPLVSRAKTSMRLDQGDAQFIDVIHTSGLALGYHAPLGHADFYPNHGIPIQPGCGIDVVGKCSHRRSYHFFQESIANKSQFMAVPCASWRQYKKRKCPNKWKRMGEHVEYGIKGKFFLQTSRKSPYDLGFRTVSRFPTPYKIKRARRVLINFFLRYS